MSNEGSIIVGLLGIAFIVLKLCGVIHWSWWYVTLPFWGGIAVVLAILLIYFLFRGAGFLYSILEKAFNDGKI